MDEVDHVLAHGGAVDAIHEATILKSRILRLKMECIFIPSRTYEIGKINQKIGIDPLRNKLLDAMNSECFGVDPRLMSHLKLYGYTTTNLYYAIGNLDHTGIFTILYYVSTTVA